MVAEPNSHAARGKFRPGTQFRGNVNGAEMEVVRIEGGNAIIKDLKTGRESIYGLRALEHCDVEVTGWRPQLHTGVNLDPRHDRR